MHGRRGASRPRPGRAARPALRSNPLGKCGPISRRRPSPSCPGIGPADAAPQPPAAWSTPWRPRPRDGEGARAYGSILETQPTRRRRTPTLRRLPRPAAVAGVASPKRALHSQSTTILTPTRGASSRVRWRSTKCWPCNRDAGSDLPLLQGMDVMSYFDAASGLIDEPLRGSWSSRMYTMATCYTSAARRT